MITDYGNLLNQNIKVVKEVDGRDTILKFINTSNGMELATIWVYSADECELWVNPGGFMTKMDWLKEKTRKELHELNAEMVNEE